MTAEALPADVDAFIGEHIHSVEQLEVLLLLRRGRSGSWTPDQIARELRIDPGSAGRRLEDLSARRLVVKGEPADCYRYAPTDASLDGRVEKLAQAYAERRVSVITRIFTTPDPAKSFADAFRIKERK